MVSAIELSVGIPEIANVVALYAFYVLVIGIGLQIVSYLRYDDSAPKPEGFTKAQHSPTESPSNLGWMLVILGSIIVLAFGSTAYYLTFGTSSNVPLGSSSGCNATGNDGTVFVSTTLTVSIGICGKSFLVRGGIGGGLSYAYHSGVVTFTAPSSVNGSQFDSWYAVIGSNPPAHVSNTTLVLNLPNGLDSKNSLIALSY